MRFFCFAASLFIFLLFSSLLNMKFFGSFGQCSLAVTGVCISQISFSFEIDDVTICMTFPPLFFRLSDVLFSVPLLFGNRTPGIVRPIPQPSVLLKLVSFFVCSLFDSSPLWVCLCEGSFSPDWRRFTVFRNFVVKLPCFPTFSHAHVSFPLSFHILLFH